MRVVLFGSTGMVGQGVLRECLLASDVEMVLSIRRSSSGFSGSRPITAAGGPASSKLRDVVLPDVSDLSSIEGELARCDACFFCLGVSSAGMSEQDYGRVTYDLTLAVAEGVRRIRPSMAFVYVSGAGTDSSEQGRTMWARVKGRTENALLARLPRAYMFRPAVILPLHGVRSRTRLYRVFYATARPLFPLLRRVGPKYVTTTEQVGRAMLNVARHGAPRRVLESADIAALA